MACPGNPDHPVRAVFGAHAVPDPATARRAGPAVTRECRCRACMPYGSARRSPCSTWATVTCSSCPSPRPESAARLRDRPRGQAGRPGRKPADIAARTASNSEGGPPGGQTGQETHPVGAPAAQRRSPAWHLAAGAVQSVRRARPSGVPSTDDPYRQVAPIHAQNDGQMTVKRSSREPGGQGISVVTWPFESGWPDLNRRLLAPKASGLGRTNPPPTACARACLLSHP
jgi:hypothetical protein